MRKAKITVFSLIFVFLFSVNAFAELFSYNPITGDLESVSGIGTSSISQVQLSPTSIFDVDSHEFRYYSKSSWNNGYVSSNICDGECTTGHVKLVAKGDMDIEVLLDGEPVEFENGTVFSNCGSYKVREASTQNTLLEFTILNKITGFVYSYDLPSVYYLYSVIIDDEVQQIQGNCIDMTKEGEYLISYTNSADGRASELNVTVDHTAPELEITGVENGEAHQAVIFGKLESESNLKISLDGVEIDPKAQYTKPGNYYIEYTDEAGNMSVYEFTLFAFIDLKAWIVIAIVVCFIIALGAYMFYWHRHMPRS